GIRDFHVTGVQTCALPISHRIQGWPAVGRLDELHHVVPPDVAGIGAHRADKAATVHCETRTSCVELLASSRADRPPAAAPPRRRHATAPRGSCRCPPRALRAFCPRRPEGPPCYTRPCRGGSALRA